MTSLPAAFCTSAQHRVIPAPHRDLPPPRAEPLKLRAEPLKLCAEPLKPRAETFKLCAETLKPRAESLKHRAESLKHRAEPVKPRAETIEACVRLFEYAEAYLDPGTYPQEDLFFLLVCDAVFSSAHNIYACYGLSPALLHSFLDRV